MEQPKNGLTEADEKRLPKLLTVWKWHLEPGMNILDVPQAFGPLHVQEQRGKACLWALVDPTAPEVKAYFFALCTGLTIRNYFAVDHIGSVLLEGGDIVWHVFQVSTAAIRRANNEQGDAQEGGSNV